MKTLWAAVLTLFVATLVAPVLTQGKFQTPTQDNKQTDLMDIKGTVRSENSKVTFVADEGGKTWDVLNPETLKDHVGKHVQVNVRVDTDKGQIRVVSLILL
jgi:membrane protein implicated in regulation of membrane protease activity